MRGQLNTLLYVNVSPLEKLFSYQSCNAVQAYVTKYLNTTRKLVLKTTKLGQELG